MGEAENLRYGDPCLSSHCLLAMASLANHYQQKHPPLSPPVPVALLKGTETPSSLLICHFYSLKSYFSLISPSLSTFLFFIFPFCSRNVLSLIFYSDFRPLACVRPVLSLLLSLSMRCSSLPSPTASSLWLLPSLCLLL